MKDPKGIETESFVIIQSIIEELKPDYVFNNKMEEMIIKRAIHTSADFDYLDNLVFTHDVVNKMVTFFKNGGTIFTDTTMALSGINKRVLDSLGIKYHCFISDPEIIKMAKEKKITRSMAAIEYASQLPGDKVFVVGNAPTAIYKLLEMIDEKELDVKAIIGAPVGFVGAEESKEALYGSDVPAIVARGRKGGSNVAAAIINAILYQMDV
ncbi:cobalt-precorrin-8 methylmutase [Enterococcus faecalis]|nr:cobalt-precorrin-8 methylmutase [Enterococcus faecalis]